MKIFMIFVFSLINAANAEVREITFKGSCGGVPGIITVKEVLRDGSSQSVCLAVENLPDFDYHKNGFWSDIKQTFAKKRVPRVLHKPFLYEDNQLKEADGLFGFAKNIVRAPFPDRFLRQTISFRESLAGVKSVESRFAEYGKYEDFFGDITCFLDDELSSKVVSQETPSLKEVEAFSFCPNY
jgi:hypothetical protein